MDLNNTQKLPIAIIGAGPVGLAAAAHVIQRNLQPVVFEKGAAPADAVRSWSHVRVFSPWTYNIDDAARSLLEESGWRAPNSDELPTGAELLAKYLEPLAAHPKLSTNIRFNAKVTSIARKKPDGPFIVEWSNATGEIKRIEASAVIDASGTWFSPNPIGTDGKPIPGEYEISESIHYGIPDVFGKDRKTYEGRRILVIGAGHSAIHSILDLLRLQKTSPATKVFWALRRNRLEKLFGGGLNDKLPARGALGNAAKDAIERKLLTLLVPFSATRVEKNKNGIKVSGKHDTDRFEFEVDRIIVATGFRPDLKIFHDLRVSLDPVLEAPPALAPLIDPNLHSCGTVPPHGFQELSHPEPGFFIVGSKSYGKAPTFLMATGYEQVRSVVAEIAGDHEAAMDVRLVLPETGVCSTQPKQTGTSCCGDSQDSKKKVEIIVEREQKQFVPEIGLKSEGCCGGPAPTEGSCCVKDHEAKLAGQSGCGCGTATLTGSANIRIQSSCCATA